MHTSPDVVGTSFATDAMEVTGKGNNPGKDAVGIDQSSKVAQIRAIAQVRGYRGEHVAHNEGAAGAGQVKLGAVEDDRALGTADHRDG